MGKKYLIDTNSIIDYLDNKLSKKANEFIDTIASKISVISRMELLGWPGASIDQTKVLEAFISNSEVYALDEPVIIKTIEIRKTSKTKLPDAIIAATAIVNKLVLITRNTRDFHEFEGLNVLNPYEVKDLQTD